MKAFQVLSRNNDVNGNPYRLILVYDGAVITAAYEARSSSPNIVGKLRPMPQLPTFHVSPSEYRETKRALGSVEIQYVD